jgi:hypothetical protein
VLIGSRLRQDRLFDQKKRSDFFTGGTDGAKDRRDGEPQRIIAEGKNVCRCCHQERADDQQQAPPESVRHGSDDNRHHRAAGKRRGKDPSDGRRAQSYRVKIETEDNREKTVR